MILKSKNNTSEVLKLRNSLLVESDWTQVPDSPLSEEQKAAWKIYRQALRDLTKNPEWPDVELPKKPS